MSKHNYVALIRIKTDDSKLMRKIGQQVGRIDKTLDEASLADLDGLNMLFMVGGYDQNIRESIPKALDIFDREPTPEETAAARAAEIVTLPPEYAEMDADVEQWRKSRES